MLGGNNGAEMVRGHDLAMQNIATTSRFIAEMKDMA
jgi:hypothetical protein